MRQNAALCGNGLKKRIQRFKAKTGIWTMNMGLILNLSQTINIKLFQIPNNDK